MASVYYKNLLKKVIDASSSDDWESAVMEWKIADCEEDESCSSVCMCGKENIRYLFTIKNEMTGKYLEPIGSSCIKKFEREDLNSEVNVQMELYHLLHAVENNERIEMTSEFFSKKLLYELYKRGAFVPNKFNKYDEYNDYQFLLDMFNKRDKSSITGPQKKKIWVIIAYSIKPFLRKELKSRR